MNVGAVFARERIYKGLGDDEVAERLGVSRAAYALMEAGDPEMEKWASVLADIAIALESPISRLISPTGRFDPDAENHGPGRLALERRRSRGMDVEGLALSAGIAATSIIELEGDSRQADAAALSLLRLSEILETPIFNLLYPGGIRCAELKEFP